ncbi:MAG: DNA cytosine methyltransferase [Sporichthyaceae bacterium]
MTVNAPWTVVDLFSGGGGMSYGFHARSDFALVAAADAQLGKPSSPRGSLGCNLTYAANMGIAPKEIDLSQVGGTELREALGLLGPLDVLSACPPCTGFTRTNANNHLVDDARNNLVRRVAEFVRALAPKVVMMENARELLRGNFGHHAEHLVEELETLGYTVHTSIHRLDRFGLPQIRERAIVIAARSDLQLRTLEDLWAGFAVENGAVTVRRAIGHLPPIAAGEVCASDPEHAAPSFAGRATLERIRAVPHDGGSWRDLLGTEHLTPAMQDLVRRSKLGTHPDVYGRVAWDAPAPTIKRECSHVGNGRYSHPEQDRLLSLREMAILNGFPADYRFGGTSLSNKYRHVGDAVPPLIGYQLAAVAAWILTGIRPTLDTALLPGTHLRPEDVVPVSAVAA